MEEKPIPEYLSINNLCSLMGISRSRYYQLISEGLILPPVQSDSKRPYFTRELALKNLEVKKNNIGINGKICIFYNCRFPSISSAKKPVKKDNKKQTTDKYDDLIIGLNSLGIQNIKSSQVDEVVKKCFPDGTDSIDEGEVLKQVFCLIKAQNSTDNVNG
jgi:hypothetical protein